MKEKLAKIREEILKQIDASENLDKLNEVRVSALGKKGALTELLKSMKEVAPQDRPKVGQMVNEVRAEIETALETEKAKLEDRVMEARLKNEVIDVTLPAKEKFRWTSSSQYDRSGRGRENFRWHGLRSGSRSRSREGLLQLRSAEYPEGPSGKRRAGYLLYQQGHCAAYPDLSGTGSYRWNRASCRSV